MQDFVHQPYYYGSQNFYDYIAIIVFAVTLLDIDCYSQYTLTISGMVKLVTDLLVGVANTTKKNIRYGEAC